jgi:hypothetical protein
MAATLGLGRVTSSGIRWVLACGLVAPSTALGQPLVRVRAETRIQLSAEPSEHGVTVRGSVVDDLGAGLGDRVVHLTVSPEASDGTGEQRLSVRTSPDGTFATSLALPHARYRILASFPDEPLQTGGNAVETLDLSKRNVQLAFVKPAQARIDLERAEHEVVVHARSVGETRGLEVVLSDETGRELGRGLTDTQGVFQTALRANALGKPGRGRLQASTQGDAARSGAHAAIDLLRFARTQLGLRAQPNVARGSLVVSGRLDSLGKPLAGKAIGLFDGNEHLASVATDDRGSFRYEAIRLPLPGGEDRVLSLQARYESEAPWLGSSRSAPQRVALAAPEPPSPWPLGAMLGACGLLLWLLRRRELPRLAASDTVFTAGVRASGDRTSALRSVREIAGEVRDAQTQRPIAGAELVLAHTTTAVESQLQTDAGGRFRSTALADGKWRLRVTAHGYRGVETEIDVPHRGQWSGLQVALQSLRALARLAYKPAALRRLRSPAWFEQLTPRETLEVAREDGKGEAAFAQLTDLVERALYARRTPTEQDIAAIEAATREASPHLPPKGSSGA